MRTEHGMRTRILLISSMVVVIAAVTASSLLIVRHQLGRRIAAQFSQDLILSVETFGDIEAQRLLELQRESALLANLPSLKALMTTSDERTITNSSLDFWKMSGNDLFALADKNGIVITAHSRGPQPGENFRTDLRMALGVSGRHYVLSGPNLYEFAVRPLYFGGDETGTLLGYVVNGDLIDERYVRQITHASAVEAAYLNENRVVVSTLPSLVQDRLISLPARPDGKSPIQTAKIHGEHFLLTQQDISRDSAPSLKLVVFKSFATEERDIGEIDKLVGFVGLLATGIGAILMLVLSGRVTQPLEALAKGVRAFGVGEVDQPLPTGGTLEIRELSTAFAGMREQLRKTNQALLESERLATIGRMAYSVSHDLRHYLSTIYANSEFLMSSWLSAVERQEIFRDIGTAVHGTTDLLDSLLIFSKAGTGKRRSHELMATLLERTMALVRSHPDAREVVLTAEYGDPVDTDAYVDPRQIERAIFNLLLNACQSYDGHKQTQRVAALLEHTEDCITLIITDDGPGVPDTVRSSLFEAFVSEGKQKGTGLGLTLVQSIAADHNGHAELHSTRSGQTVFQMTIRRTSGQSVRTEAVGRGENG